MTSCFQAHQLGASARPTLRERRRMTVHPTGPSSACESHRPVSPAQKSRCVAQRRHSDPAPEITREVKLIGVAHRVANLGERCGGSRQPPGSEGIGLAALRQASPACSSAASGASQRPGPGPAGQGWPGQDRGNVRPVATALPQVAGSALHDSHHGSQASEAMTAYGCRQHVPRWRPENVVRQGAK